MALSPIPALEQNYLYGAFGALTGGRKVGGITPGVVTGGQPAGGAVTFGSNNGTGEIISDYGQGGASAGAYKGLSNNPNDTVGAKFDTARLPGIYGY